MLIPHLLWGMSFGMRLADHVVDRVQIDGGTVESSYGDGLLHVDSP
jgi:hypothetical protein